jgi:hypothetical protein
METNALYLIAIILSLLSSIISWVVKLKWSKEFKEAKDAQINMLKEKVEFYKELTPKKVKELYAETNESLKEVIKNLEEQLNKSNNDIVDLQNILETVRLNNPDSEDQGLTEIAMKYSSLNREANKKLENTMNIIIGTSVKLNQLGRKYSKITDGGYSKYFWSEDETQPNP